MQHIDKTIHDLRQYIAASDDKSALEEVDALLAVALLEVRRKLATSRNAERGSIRGPT